WGKEFVAGGFGGSAGIMAGYPLDSIRVRQQSNQPGSAFSILKNVVAKEGPLALYRGMAAPLASCFLLSRFMIQHFMVLGSYLVLLLVYV
nr:mitochondrial arginine transporter BAC2-like [Tanacetum cinerariifolium]